MKLNRWNWAVVSLGLMWIAVMGAALPAQDLGKDQVDVWAGTLDAGAVQLRVEFRVTTAEDGTRSAEMVSLDQGNVKIGVDEVKVDGNSLEFVVNRVRGGFQGTFNAARDECVGEWTQLGNKLPLTIRLSKSEAQPAEPKATWENRPQRPREPFPYKSEEVKFENPTAKIRLAGTLTLPPSDAPVPAVILVTGSGPQDRDETLMAHKPFLVLADWLTRNGIAVLRYDDRGVGASMGNFAKATSRDFADDAKAAIDYLATRPEVNPGKLGIIGHSEGGLIAPMVALDSRKVGFIVLLAGPGVDGGRIIESQSAQIAEKMGAPAADVEKAKALNRRLIAEVRKTPADQPIMDALDGAFDAWVASLPAAEQELAANSRSQIQQMAAPWFRYFVNYDPQPALRKLTCPTLALQGGLDVQVLENLNIPAIRQALSANGVAGNEVQVFPQLNHLFQQAETGLPSEYVKIDETMNEAVLKKVVQWIQQR